VSVSAPDVAVRARFLQRDVGKLGRSRIQAADRPSGFAVCFTRDLHSAVRPPNELPPIKEIEHALEQGPAVLSTGGGAFIIDDVRHHIGRKAISIWLNSNEDVIRQNLKHNTKRPKLRTSDQGQTISDLMQARNSI